MAAKSAFALRHYDAVAPILFEFFQRFPESSYQADAYYTIGMTSFVTHKYADAGRQLVHCAELAAEEPLRSRWAGLLERVTESSLSAEQMRELYASARSPVAKELLRLKLAERVYADGEPSRARNILDDTTAGIPAGPYAARTRAFRQRISEFVSVKIGALLPLLRGSEPNATKILAEEILDGMSYALTEYKANRPASAPTVVLDARDIGRDTASALRELDDLARSAETIAAVGPVFSNIAFACANAAEAAGLPLISPTATSNGIAAVGPHIFQANPDFATRGKAMAQFAATQLGLRRVAVLAPAEGVGHFVAESFAAEARRQGMTLVAVESYGQGVGDLREQCMRLRRAATSSVRQLSFAGKVPEADIRKLLEAGAGARVLDSVRTRAGVISARDLFGSERGGAIAESLRLSILVPVADPEKVDTPMSALDGLFIPLNDNEEMGAIAPQLAFFNLRTQLLGSNEWYDAGKLNEHKRYVNGVMFLSDTYVSADDPAYAAFDAAYLAAVKKRPTKYSLYGYDTMRLLLERIAAGATGRKELAKQLGLVRHYRGVHAKITLASGRVNSDVHILQFSNGRISEIGDLSVE
jgi:ABC-type branched-subunit amino acid transport system substrate-binding protein